MAVLVRFWSVIVKNEVLEDLYPGGVEGYRNDCPKQTFCTDGHITCAMVMDPNDVSRFISILKDHGLLYMHRGQSRDIAVIYESKGLTAPCNWLSLDTSDDGMMFCWLSSNSPGEIVAPEGWAGKVASFRFDPEEEENLRYVKTENHLDIYEDQRTGKLFCTPRYFDGRDIEMRRERLADIVMRICKLGEKAEKERMNNNGKIDSDLESELQDLCETARQLKEEEEGPLEAESRLLYGIALRTLARWEEAENEFRILVSSYPDVIGGWIELTSCLGRQEKFEEAEEAAYRGIHVAPGSAAAWGNFAFSLIQTNQRDEALAAIEMALTLDPDDKGNRWISDNFDSLFRKKGN